MGWLREIMGGWQIKAIRLFPYLVFFVPLIISIYIYIKIDSFLLG